MKNDYRNEKILIFDNNDVYNKILRDLKLIKRLGKSFDFIYEKLIVENKDFNGKDLNTLKFNEGKNYNWVAFTVEDVKFIIRQYGSHLTVYLKFLRYECESYKDYEYGAFTFHADIDKLNIDDDEHDRLHELYYEEPLHEFNKTFTSLLKNIKKRHLHGIWNDLSYERPKHCKVNLIFDGESISSVDKLIFCAEEFSTLHVQLFAENEMIEMLKNIKLVKGMKLGRDKIESINTKFPTDYSDPYYHAIGIKPVGTHLSDVYSLTRWYLEDVEKLVNHRKEKIDRILKTK